MKKAVRRLRLSRETLRLGAVGAGIPTGNNTVITPSQQNSCLGNCSQVLSCGSTPPVCIPT
jgi:hypothetical protein